MCTTVDFLELATYCKQDIEQKCAESDRKRDYEILYAAICDDDSIKISRTPHILKSAKRCILVHSWLQLASTISYDTYLVQCINENGEVIQNALDSDYSINISPSSFNNYARIYLSRNTYTIYQDTIWSNCKNILHKKLTYVWNLYKKSKTECKTLKESQLLGELARSEQTIEELESKLADSSVNELLLKAEAEQYRSLLDEIKKLVGDNLGGHTGIA